MRWVPQRLVQGNDECTDWFREHGVDPTDLRAGDVGIDIAGQVHVDQYRRSRLGALLHEGYSVLSDPVVIVPDRPFPIEPVAEVS